MICIWSWFVLLLQMTLAIWVHSVKCTWRPQSSRVKPSGQFKMFQIPVYSALSQSLLSSILWIPYTNLFHSSFITEPPSVLLLRSVTTSVPIEVDGLLFPLPQNVAKYRWVSISPMIGNFMPMQFQFYASWCLKQQ